MTPEERAHMRAERRHMFENMSPEERKKWHDEMRRQRMDRKADQGMRNSPGAPNAAANPGAPNASTNLVAPNAAANPGAPNAPANPVTPDAATRPDSGR
jgi:hypothetical protein